MTVSEMIEILQDLDEAGLAPDFEDILLVHAPKGLTRKTLDRAWAVVHDIADEEVSPPFSLRASNALENF